MMEEKLKILIVEDEALIAENLKMSLEDFGYEVDEPVNSYDDAVAAIATNRYDVVLLDINLQNKKTGIDIGHLLSANYNIPFVFLTANSDESTIKKAIAAKPSAFLTKPANAAALFASLQIALNNHSQQTIATNTNKEPAESFFIKLGKKNIRVRWANIASIEADRNYVKFLVETEKGKYAGYPIRSSMQRVVNDMLPSGIKHSFVQVNRSQFIRTDAIKSLSGNVLETDFGSCAVSESYITTLKQIVKIG